MHQKLLVICGPTATGKTKLALVLAKKLGGLVISADSRQVYKYMDIGTGKDKYKYGQILGYDLLNPNEEFNVSSYQDFARKAIKKAHEQKKLPILVGGTGFYLKALTQDIATIDTPQDKKLRLTLASKSSDQLFATLTKLNPSKAASLNNSDKNNPRRLIRAIEIAKSKKLKTSKFSPRYEVLWIGLIAPLKDLREKIDDRVDQRIKSGFAREVNFLKKNNYWNFAPKVTLGYKDWPDVSKWKSEEFKYAKRQITWFKKNERINWFDISQKSWPREVEKLVEKWYSVSENAKKN